MGIYGIPWNPALPLSSASCFAEEKPLVVEIGFGMGAATWRIALERPDAVFIGIEVHKPGVGRLLSDIERNGIGNLKVIHHDAVEVVESMTRPSSIHGFHVFYPDPWPKKRHQKRRIMKRDFVDLLVDRLVPGGYLYFVTDIQDYAERTKDLLDGTRDLGNSCDGYAPRKSWRHDTKFEGKASLAGRNAWELFYVKTGR
jgi:tRNA (guanine-N7-)-methyltransferase